LHFEELGSLLSRRELLSLTDDLGHKLVHDHDVVT
jgi:hypothetical protein